MKSKNVSLAVEIYPREGTETYPRPYLPLSITLKFIPVRGRKRFTAFYIFFHMSVEIYPREGTETFVVLPCRHNNLVEIYPREGTETYFLPVVRK